MKTKITAKTFQSVKKIALHVAVAAVFCLLNCLVLQAQEYEIMYPDSDRDYFKFTNEEEPEAILQFQSWMLDFHTKGADHELQPRIIHDQENVKPLEAPENEYTPEPELKVCAWMVDIETWYQTTNSSDL